MVKTSQHIFLLVTLEKAELAEQHQYEDRFLEPASFQWQSQNRESRRAVIDYFGNHRTFILKPMTLFDLEPGDIRLARCCARAGIRICRQAARQPTRRD